MRTARPTRWRGFGALGLLALTGCAGAVSDVRPITTPPPPAARPTYALGTRWIRSDGVYELVAMTEDAYLFRAAEPETSVTLSRDLAPTDARRAFHALSGRFDFHPPPRIAWPLTVGARGVSEGWWSFTFEETHWVETTRPGASPQSRTYTFLKTVEAEFHWAVEAYERVRVPAGAFDAYRLYYEIKPKNPKDKAPKWWLRTWYAPAIRQFVAAEGKNADPFEFTLVGVDPATTEPLQLVVRDPEDKARVTRKDLTVAGRVASGKGIARVTVSVNGAEVVRRDERGAPQEAAIEAAVTLREGRNVILITATDVSGQSRQEARTVVYDAGALRDAAEGERARAREAREAARRAGAPTVAAAAWAAAERAEAEAAAALAAGDLARAEDGYRGAREGYTRAANAAALSARLAQERRETAAAGTRVEEARRAAEAAGAARRAGAVLAKARAAEEAARAAGAREDFDAARQRFAEAEAGFREAEREALRLAAAEAAVERERQDVARRQYLAAERVARLAEQARQEAEQADAGRLAADAFGRARGREADGRAALARGDALGAEARFGEAATAYREAVREARAEAERLTRRERERDAAQRAGEETARARVTAEQAGAPRLAAALLAEGRRAEDEARAAAARGEHAAARRGYRAAGEAYERAAAEARAIAAQPMQVTLTSPADQARVDQERLTLAGAVTSGRGVRRVLVTVNGVEVTRRDEPTPARSLSLNLPLTLREGLNTVVVTATDAEGNVQQEVRAVQYARPVPLVLSVRFPEDGARVTAPASVVAAVAESGRGIARVRVMVNGQEVHQQTERRPLPSVPVAVPITLRPGSNVVVVAVAEPDGTSRQEQRTVVYEPPRDAGPASAGGPGAPMPAREDGPALWAVVVGVGGYDSPAIPRLRYTVADAEAVGRALGEVSGFSKSHVLLLTDRSERKPTLRNLKWALGTYLGRSARKADTVVIFFAGHGAPEVDTTGRERDGLAKYLVPLDADPDDLYSTGLPMEEFETIFNRIEAERIVVFLDTCYSGAAGGRTFASKRTRGTPDEAFVERLVRAKGKAIITASRAAEVSVELPELGHGIFTYYLVRGLRGAADADRDGIVTLQELYPYVVQRVSRHARQVGGKQQPVMRGDFEGVLPLARTAR